MLLRIAQTNKVAVVVTNQMQSNPDGMFGEKSTPVGGQVMLHASTHVIHLRRLKLNNHVTELDISPYYPHKVIDFVIDQSGVADGSATHTPLRRRI